MSNEEGNSEVYRTNIWRLFHDNLGVICILLMVYLIFNTISLILMLFKNEELKTARHPPDSEPRLLNVLLRYLAVTDILSATIAFSYFWSNQRWSWLVQYVMEDICFYLQFVNGAGVVTTSVLILTATNKPPPSPTTATTNTTGNNNNNPRRQRQRRRPDHSGEHLCRFYDSNDVVVVVKGGHHVRGTTSPLLQSPYPNHHHHRLLHRQQEVVINPRLNHHDHHQNINNHIIPSQPFEQFETPTMTATSNNNKLVDNMNNRDGNRNNLRWLQLQNGEETERRSSEEDSWDEDDISAADDDYDDDGYEMEVEQRGGCRQNVLSLLWLVSLLVLIPNISYLSVFNQHGGSEYSPTSVPPPPRSLTATGYHSFSFIRDILYSLVSYLILILAVTFMILTMYFNNNNNTNKNKTSDPTPERDFSAPESNRNADVNEEDVGVTAVTDNNIVEKEQLSTATNDPRIIKTVAATPLLHKKHNKVVLVGRKNLQRKINNVKLTKFGTPSLSSPSSSTSPSPSPPPIDYRTNLYFLSIFILYLGTRFPSESLRYIVDGEDWGFRPWDNQQQTPIMKSGDGTTNTAGNAAATPTMATGTESTDVGSGSGGGGGVGRNTLGNSNVSIGFIFTHQNILNSFVRLFAHFIINIVYSDLISCSTPGILAASLSSSNPGGTNSDADDGGTNRPAGSRSHHQATASAARIFSPVPNMMATTATVVKDGSNHQPSGRQIHPVQYYQNHNNNNILMRQQQQTLLNNNQFRHPQQSILLPSPFTKKDSITSVTAAASHPGGRQVIKIVDV